MWVRVRVRVQVRTLEEVSAKVPVQPRPPQALAPHRPCLSSYSPSPSKNVLARFRTRLPAPPELQSLRLCRGHQLCRSPLRSLHGSVISFGSSRWQSQCLAQLLERVRVRVWVRVRVRVRGSEPALAPTAFSAVRWRQGSAIHPAWRRGVPERSPARPPRLPRHCGEPCPGRLRGSHLRPFLLHHRAFWSRLPCGRRQGPAGRP